MVSLEQLQSSVTNFIRVIKGRRREQSAFALAAACFSAGYFAGGSKWIPEWPQGKEWRSLATVQIALYVVGALAFVYAVYRIWRATHAPDLPPPKDRPLAIKGPSAFTPGDGELFRRLGRETELQELMGYVLDNQTPLVVLMGESGAGKTSLLRAGLPHILKDKGVRVHYWEAVPTDSAERLLRAIQEDWSANGEKKLAQLEDLINPAVDALGTEQHVVVMDQFEQLRHDNPVLKFIRSIARYAQPPHRITWIVAFRREYRADWADLMIPEQERGFYPKEMSLRLFTSEAARDVISQLIQEAGLQVEQPVVNNLIAAAANADNRVSPVDLGIGLLVLAELHDRLGGRTLTVKDYQFAGGAEGLLTQYINRCLERFAETEREPLLKALLALRNPETNQRLAEGLPLDKLATEAATDERRLQPQLERLAQRDIRLLETVTPKNAGKDGVMHYRLPNDRLIPALHRLTGKLLGEMEQAQLCLEEAFLAWQSNKKRKRYLLRGASLRLVKRSASQIQWGHAESEKRSFLQKSQREQFFSRLFLVYGLIGIVVMFSSLFYLNREHDRYLRERNYPPEPELYAYQHRLKKLELTGPLNLEQFRWVSSDSIEELAIKVADNSNSIENLATGFHSLGKLTLDLRQSNVGNLEPLAKLSNLRQLTLYFGGGRVINLEPLAKLSNLRQLTLNPSAPDVLLIAMPGQVSNLESLAALKNMTQLTLDLHWQENSLESLAKLNSLTQLTLDLRGSQVSNLESLAKLNNLMQLTLNLNSQVSNLEPLAKLSNLTQLSLDLSNSQVSSLEPLTKLPNLQKLSLLNATRAQRMSIQKLPPNVVELSF